MKSHVIHFGCRLNQYEADSLSESLESVGLENGEVADADFVIINSCTVTNKADHKNRNAIRRVHSVNPRAKIIVTGCYATTDADVLQTMPGVYWVVDNSSKAGIAEMIKAEISASPVISPHSEQSGALVIRDADLHFSYRARSLKGNARAYLKIQDGCNKSCSYCKIPQARGKGRSRDFTESVAEARRLIDLGFHEIILTGVNMGWYKSGDGRNFYDLVEEILNLPGEFFLRLSSLEPPDINERLAGFYLHEKMAPFLHAPLQSGSRQILKWMHRGYTPRHFAEWISLVRAVRPDVHVGTDLIVGFPGETPDLFEESLAFCRDMEFANMHIFPFAKRNHTPVLDLLGTQSAGVTIREIHGTEIRNRCAQAAQYNKEGAASYRQLTAGREYRAIAVQSTHPHIITENYLKFALPNPSELKHGQLIRLTYDADGEIKLNHGNRQISQR